MNIHVQHKLDKITCINNSYNNMTDSIGTCSYVLNISNYFFFPIYIIKLNLHVQLLLPCVLSNETLCIYFSSHFLLLFNCR